MIKSTLHFGQVVYTNNKRETHNPHRPAVIWDTGHDYYLDNKYHNIVGVARYFLPGDQRASVYYINDIEIGTVQLTLLINIYFYIYVSRKDIYVN